MPIPLILAGAGHAHLVALHDWLHSGYRPPEGTLLLSPSPHAWYSGMMPGLIAGRFVADECAIALEPLCQACGINLQIGSIRALEADSRRLHLDNDEQLQAEWLSLNVGSIPPAPLMQDSLVEVIPAKPFPAFHRAWSNWMHGPAPAHLAVLGGGAAACELALALHQSLPGSTVSLICSRLLAEHPARLGTRMRGLFEARAIGLIEGYKVTHLAGDQLFADEQALLATDAVILATGASAHDWQAASGLDCDESGFIRVSPTLQSLSHPGILASGDCASVPGALRSGVFAVRQGPILAANLPALLEDRALTAYQPQKKSLALLATADGGALMSYGPQVAGGRLAGIWKDYLDLGFMRRHRVES